MLNDEAARIAAALGHAMRLRIVDMLIQREMGVDEIVSRVGAPLTTVSSHLRRLRDARIVETRRDGTRIRYRIGDSAVVRVLVELHGLAERRSAEALAFVREVADEHADVDTVPMGEVLRRLEHGDVTLVDVRPRDEYLAGHIPGAISVPLDELDDAQLAVPAAGELVAYCRDRHCVLSPQAVRALRARGIATSRLDIGYAEWLAAHIEIDRREPA